MSDRNSPSLADLTAQFPEYDLRGIEEGVKQFQPVQRFSQRAEAARLAPLVAHIIQASPHLTASQIALVLKENAGAVTDKLGPTFCREISKQVRAIKTGKPRSLGTNRTRAVSTSKVLVMPAHVPAAPSVAESAKRAEGNSTSPQRSVTSTPKLTPVKVVDERPYQFSGKFAGMVFKSTVQLRRFYSAIERQAPMIEVVELADAVLADLASLDAVVQFEPLDRAIFDAVAKMIAGGLP